jgi:HSP20 family protein
MRGNPALPGSPLKSKPTWLSTFGCLATSAFFVRAGRRGPDEWSFTERHRDMLRTRWQPLGMVWPEMNQLREEMERRLGRFVMNDPTRRADSVYPLLNLWEDGNNLYVEAELPDLEVSDLEILVKGDNELSIKGERKQPELGKGTWHRRERGHGEFSRVGELPQYVDGEKVTAGFKHGVLTITLPKRKEAVARRIEAKAT